MPDRYRGCPNCMLVGVLLGLGYYNRWVSSSDRRKTTLVSIRRFRCHACRLSTSMLPDFAQPYRLVTTDTVEQYLGGSRCGEAVDAWADLLEDYQRRFDERLPLTVSLLSSAYELAKLPRTAVEVWCEICRCFGGARCLTARLASDVGVTVFGIYRCQHPAGAVSSGCCGASPLRWERATESSGVCAREETSSRPRSDP